MVLAAPKPEKGRRARRDRDPRLDPDQPDRGHYLRLGLALQLTTEAHEVDGSKALDATIDLFSGRTTASLSRPERRDELRRSSSTSSTRAPPGSDGRLLHRVVTQWAAQIVP